jgi:hypothetical protein
VRRIGGSAVERAALPRADGALREPDDVAVGVDVDVVRRRNLRQARHRHHLAALVDRDG